jgi:putative membrane protein
MTPSDLPALNACLNAASLVCVLIGWWHIRRRNVPAHRASMVTALTLSSLFLVSYVIYHYAHGHTLFPGTGLARVVYFSILFTHLPLAILLVPLLVTAVWKAVRGDLPGHRRVVKWALPVWIYVSITGVAIYLMLYQMDWQG